MTISLDSIGTIATILGLFIAGGWGLIKAAAWQFNKSLDQRFEAQEKIREAARTALEARMQRLEKAEGDFRTFQADVNRDFVRRDDYVRDFASIKVMIENLALVVDRKLTEIWQEMRKN